MLTIKEIAGFDSLLSSQLFMSRISRCVSQWKSKIAIFVLKNSQLYSKEVKKSIQKRKVTPLLVFIMACPRSLFLMLYIYKFTNLLLNFIKLEFLKGYKHNNILLSLDEV